MIVFHHPDSRGHNPDHYFRAGTLGGHPENLERFGMLHKGAFAAASDFRQAEDHGLSFIEKVHDPDYINFLKTGWQEAQKLGPGRRELLSTHFSTRILSRRPDSLMGQAGFYTSDTSTPLLEDSWQAIYMSAQVGISAALYGAEHGLAYGLCRPPGHHAYHNSAAGFCYLNNAAIAAEALKARLGGPVAILDIDIHHGNGTQDIFWERSDVVTVSLHCDPSNYYPYYTGYADETGQGAGAGFNKNYPLPPGTDDEAFTRELSDALAFIKTQNPKGIVISFGLDTAKDDPLGNFAVTQDGYSKCAKLIKSIALSTVIIQEGGYICDTLSDNLNSFLTGFGEG